MARRLFMLVLSVDVTSKDDQALNNRNQFLLNSDVKWRVSIFVTKVNFSFMRKQRYDTLKSVLWNHNVQSCSPIKVQRVDVATALNEGFKHFSRWSPMKRSSTVLHILGAQLVSVVLEELSDRARWACWTNRKRRLDESEVFRFVYKANW